MAKTAPQSQGLPLVSLFILANLCSLAVDALHLQLGRSDFSGLVAPFMDPSDTRMRKHFTGFKGFDEFLATMLLLFDPIFTGEMPELSLYAFHFTGQMASIVTLLAVQGLRLGTRKSPTRLATVWGIVMQGTGYGLTMPIYYLVDLLFSSSDAQGVGLTDPTRLYAIIPAFALGFIIPSALQTLPAPRDLHQILLAAWQPFPIYFGVLLWVFSNIVKKIAITGSVGTKKSVTDRNALDHAYGFAIGIGALTHWVTLGVIVAAAFAPDLFPAGIAERLTLANVFVPHALRYYGPATVASAMLQFLHYDQYIGAAAGLVWAATLAKRAGVWSPNKKGIRRILRDVLVLGPPSAVISLLRSRDEAVLGSQ